MRKKMLELSQRLERGEWIAIAADRVLSVAIKHNQSISLVILLNFLKVRGYLQAF